MNVLNEYKRTEDTAFSMVAIVLLCVDICKCDGNFSSEQHEDILELFSKTEKDADLVSHLIRKAELDKSSHIEHAEQIYEILKDQQDLLEMIIASLYKLAIADKKIHPNESQILSDVMRIFRIKPSKPFLISSRIKEFIGQRR